jgi:hypothetical protein
MDLSERFLAAEKAATARIAAIETARRDVESALARLEALVGKGGSQMEPLFEAKPNGRGNLHGTSEKTCANSRCARKFRPHSGRQKFCSRNCARQVWERQRAPRKVEEKAAETAGPFSG